MFCSASIINKYSLPSLLAGSPVQFSSWPSIANLTPASLRVAAIDLAIRWLLWSRAAVHPTQKSTSTSLSSAIVGTSIPSVHSVRVDVVPLQGWPLCSRLSRAFIAVSGRLPCSITRQRLISTMLSICSINTGHASIQARQVVHDHSTSSVT